MKVSHLHSSCQRLTAHVDPGSVDAVQDCWATLVGARVVVRATSRHATS